MGYTLYQKKDRETKMPVTGRKVKRELSLLIDATLKEIPGVERIYLFGSYAYGKPTKDSDYDLMVITEKELKHDVYFITNIRYKTFGQVNVFDMFVYSKKEFDERRENHQFENKIYNEGVVLYERN
jgi:predicted nucleotidyltransferase